MKLEVEMNFIFDMASFSFHGRFRFGTNVIVGVISIWMSLKSGVGEVCQTEHGTPRNDNA